MPDPTPENQPPKPAKGSHIFQAPTGTRDLYPDDVARRRYLTQAWRDVSIRHGFEEIEGPTFEHLDLYTVKSGEGIVSELFSFRRTGGEKDYALRPEFTPTLARMYAARAGSLQRPTKWFTAGPYFRAERPQRGRLREFLQWNVDVLGLPGDVPPDSDEAAALKAEMDADCIGCIIGLMESVGVGQDITTVHLSSRSVMYTVLEYLGLPNELHSAFLVLLDARAKLSGEDFAWKAAELGATREFVSAFDSAVDAAKSVGWGRYLNQLFFEDWTHADEIAGHEFFDLLEYLRPLEHWRKVDLGIVRGLAYYTGTVFEVIADGERAVAGGGRYDTLIELFGGPPTPAVGFGMGDVVLSLLLQDHSLMPEGPDLLDAISRPPASVRPEVFVINAGNKDDAHELEPLVTPLLANLRRGVESESWRARDDRKPWNPDRYAPASNGVRPMHARKTYKSTRNLKKLLSDAQRQHARFAAIVHAPDRVQLKDLDRRLDLTPNDVPGLPGDIAEFSVDPASPVYVGRAVHALLG